MKHIARAALAGALVLIGSAHASDGTINITGKIVGNTCTVNGSGTSVAVALPSVTASAMPSADVTQGSTPFSMKLKCTDGATPTPANIAGSVKAYFEGANVDMATGRIKLTGTNTASNLQLQLLNSDDTIIKIGDPSTIKGGVFDTNGEVTLTYKVRYYATGAVTAGSANSSVLFSLYYQ